MSTIPSSRPLFLVTRKFTGGLLDGLTLEDVTTVKRRVGQVVDKPVGGSPYVITGCEPITEQDAAALRAHTTNQQEVDR